MGQIHLAEGEFIFREGKNPQIALVQAGVVRVFLSTRPGRELTLHYARVGDLIGVAPYLARNNEWNAEAVTDADVSIFTFNDLLRAAALNPELPWRIAEYVASWTTEAMRDVAHDAGHSTRTRVARHLRELSVRDAGGQLVAHISQQHLAATVGTVREVVSRELNALRADAVIETAAGSITVIDEAGLARIAAAGPGGRSG
jgi:CRP/FNR family transcriptional regulator